MGTKRQRHTKIKMWSVEPKAPSLISLSVRDQNIPRPPKRSSSLKTAASNIRKELSSHNLLKGSACDTLQTLRRVQHHSCSALKVQKTRTKSIRPTLSSLEDEYSVRRSSESPASEAVSSDGTLLDVVEHYWDGLSQLCPISVSPRRSKPGQTRKLVQNGSSETIIHNVASRSSRTSSGMSSSTFQTTSQTRHQSARRVVSRVLKTMQVKKKENVGTESNPNTKRVEAWVKQAESDSLLAAGTPATLPASSYSTQSSDASQLAGLTNRDGVKRCQVYPPDAQLGEMTSTCHFEGRTPHEHSSNLLRHSSTSSNQGQINPWYPLSLSMTINAELTEATLTSDESIWAIAEIRTELPALPINATASCRGIAVAIVLDNSRLATRQDIENACLEIISLGTSLEEGVDHIGVYCTSESDAQDGCVLSIADPLDMTLLQHSLHGISRQPQDYGSMQAAMIQAVQALQDLQSRAQSTETLAVGNIIVITSNTLELQWIPQLDLHDFNVHLVNPSLIRYSHEALRSMLSAVGQEPLYGGMASDVSVLNHPRGWLLESHLADDPSSLGTWSLADMILFSKAQLCIGSINNVSIKIHEGEDALIEEVLGSLSYSTLLPGQTISVAIRIRLESLEKRLSIGSKSEYGSCSLLSVVDAISELELTLGNHLSELFEVQVVYSHTFFPANTRLELRESCWLPRVLEVSTCAPAISSCFDVMSRNVCVQRQLALCIASSCSPTQAIRKLNRQFANKMLSDNMISLLDALRRQLKHRDAVLAEMTLMEYALRGGPSEEQPLPESSGSRHDAAVDQYCVSDETASGTPATVIRRRLLPAYQTSTDIDEGEARRIWQQIRRTSRRDEHLMPDAEVGMAQRTVAGEEHEPHIEEIRETALKHGRKISSATLRSLAKDFHQRGSSFDEEYVDGTGSVS